MEQHISSGNNDLHLQQTQENHHLRSPLAHCGATVTTAYQSEEVILLKLAR